MEKKLPLASFITCEFTLASYYDISLVSRPLKWQCLVKLLEFSQVHFSCVGCNRVHGSRLKASFNSG